MKRTIRNIILGSLLYGGTFLAFKIKFGLSEKMVTKYYIIASVILVAVVMVVNIRWQMRFVKKLKGIEKILIEEQNPDKFIEENEKLLQSIKSDYNKAIININLSAGYCDKGDYEKAKEILLSTPVKKLTGLNEIIYYMNLAYVYFRLEEGDIALETLEKHNKDFLRLKDHTPLGGSIASLRIFEYIAHDEIPKAKDLLISSKEKWDDKRFQSDWEFLETKLNGL